jgi:hypothetical protein
MRKKHNEAWGSLRLRNDAMNPTLFESLARLYARIRCLGLARSLSLRMCHTLPRPFACSCISHCFEMCFCYYVLYRYEIVPSHFP